jgi:putative peptidoglycan lipid II flippase
LSTFRRGPPPTLGPGRRGDDAPDNGDGQWPATTGVNPPDAKGSTRQPGLARKITGRLDRSTTPKLAQRTLGMGAGTLASRVTGLAKLVALGYALGFTHLADAYNLANNTPNIVYDLVVGGLLSATVLPVFVERLTTSISQRQAWKDISATLTLAVVALVVVTVVFVFLAPQIIDLYTIGSHQPDIATQRAVATELLRLFAPQVAFYGGITLISAVLNARNRLGAIGVTPALNNLVVIVVLLCAAPFIHHLTNIGHGEPLVPASHDTALLWLLGIGTTAGVAIQLLGLLPALRGTGARLRWRWDPANQTTRVILRLSGWTVGFVIANQVALFIVLAIATSLGRGSVSAYTYAYTFFQLPFGVIAFPIMSAIQPSLAERFVRGDLAGLGHRAAVGLRVTLVGVLPAAMGYLILARPLTGLIFAHGAGRAGDISTTSSTLALFAIGLPGFCAYLYLIRVFQSMQDTRTAFRLYLLENALNIVLAFAFSVPLGTAGLALSFSVAYSVAAVVAAFVLSRRVGGLHGAGLGRAVARACLVTGIMGALVEVAATQVGTNHGIGLLFRVIVAVIVGVSVFVAGAGLLADRAAKRTLEEPRPSNANDWSRFWRP